jgi:uncharacterized protein YcbK (DUF882 family)|tara:strand:- start:915 stop:1283 length:369 start_codon:yes stop_codon:yes gene_type:complete
MTDFWDSIEHFDRREFTCHHCGKDGIKQGLVETMEILRCRLNTPLRITSGYRCEHHPESLSKPTSSHIKGLACDIAVPTSRLRFKVLDAIFDRQLFDRVGIAKTFIHVDIDEDKTQMVTWVY